MLVASRAPGCRSAADRAEGPEYFQLRPEVETACGYTHAARIGDDVRISGAVSTDVEGNLVAAGNLEQQMRNCCADLRKVLAHDGCTLDDAVVENVSTTGTAGFIAVSGYRDSVSTK